MPLTQHEIRGFRIGKLLTDAESFSILAGATESCHKAFARSRVRLTDHALSRAASPTGTHASSEVRRAEAAGQGAARPGRPPSVAGLGRRRRLAHRPK